jgi:glycosyltransferase involved in cell wall biosynthesis
MNKVEKRILFIVKLPPPITGATLMNKIIYEGIVQNSQYKTGIISANYAKNIADLGNYSFNKCVIFLKVISDLIINLVRDRPDLVYFQISPVGLPFLRDSILSLIVRLFNIKVVYHLHGLGIQDSMSKHRIIHGYYKLIFRGSDVICLSDTLTYDVAKLNIKKTYIVNNGIPTTKYKKSSRKKGAPINIMFLSNLFISKGLLLYIEAIKMLQEKQKYEFISYIVGEEGDISGKTLSKIIEDENLQERMIYLGSKYAEEKKEIFGEADIFIYPSLKDAFPCTVLEALQAGTACITSSVGALPDIIDNGKTGIVIDNISPKTILEKIEILINRNEMRNSMAIKGKKKYEEQYTSSRLVANIQYVFNEILRNNI